MGPNHKKATSSLPAPPSTRRFLLNRFSRNLKRLSRHLNRKYQVLNRITAIYFKSRSIYGKSGRRAHKSNQGTGNLQYCMYLLSLGGHGLKRWQELIAERFRPNEEATLTKFCGRRPRFPARRKRCRPVSQSRGRQTTTRRCDATNSR